MALHVEHVSAWFELARNAGLFNDIEGGIRIFGNIGNHEVVDEVFPVVSVVEAEVVEGEQLGYFAPALLHGFEQSDFRGGGEWGRRSFSFV